MSYFGHFLPVIDVESESAATVCAVGDSQSMGALSVRRRFDWRKISSCSITEINDRRIVLNGVCQCIKGGCCVECEEGIAAAVDVFADIVASLTLGSGCNSAEGSSSEFLLGQVRSRILELHASIPYSKSTWESGSYHDQCRDAVKVMAAGLSKRADSDTIKAIVADWEAKPVHGQDVTEVFLLDSSFLAALRHSLVMSDPSNFRLEALTGCDQSADAISRAVLNKFFKPCRWLDSAGSEMTVSVQKKVAMVLFRLAAIFLQLGCLQYALSVFAVVQRYVSERKFSTPVSSLVGSNFLSRAMEIFGRWSSFKAIAQRLSGITDAGVFETTGFNERTAESLADSEHCRSQNRRSDDQSVFTQSVDEGSRAGNCERSDSNNMGSSVDAPQVRPTSIDDFLRSIRSKLHKSAESTEEQRTKQQANVNTESVADVRAMVVSEARAMVVSESRAMVVSEDSGPHDRVEGISLDLGTSFASDRELIGGGDLLGSSGSPNASARARAAGRVKLFREAVNAKKASALSHAETVRKELFEKRDKKLAEWKAAKDSENEREMRLGSIHRDEERRVPVVAENRAGENRAPKVAATVPSAAAPSPTLETRDRNESRIGITGSENQSHAVNTRKRAESPQVSTGVKSLPIRSNPSGEKSSLPYQTLDRPDDVVSDGFVQINRSQLQEIRTRKLIDEIELDVDRLLSSMK